MDRLAPILRISFPRAPRMDYIGTDHHNIEPIAQTAGISTVLASLIRLNDFDRAGGGDRNLSSVLRERGTGGRRPREK
jgi:hypothetical protein